jgi:RNA polymerase sigma-70 factor, ECF subfamily
MIAAVPTASPSVTTLMDASDPAVHRDYLYRFAIRRVGDPALADDLVQETFLAALQSAKTKAAGADASQAGTFGGRSSYRVWLAGILKHKLADVMRERCRYVAINAEDPEREQDEMNAAMVASGAGDAADNPQHVCERSELFDQINAALVKLPPGVAEVFMAREVEGETTASIAARSGLSEANIWVRVHRARKALQTHLTACGAAERFAGQEFRWAA